MLADPTTNEPPAPLRLDLRAEARRLREQLCAPREAIEAAFLEVGDRLSRSSTLLDRIVGAFAALPRDLDGAEMVEAIGRLGNFASRAREIAEAFARERSDIDRLVVAVDAATHPIGDLKRSVKMMGILAVNARIVAAGLHDAADHFEVFTSDIANLSDGAVRAIGAFSAGHARLRTAVYGASAQFTEFEGSHRGVLTDLAASLEHGLSALGERRAASAGRSAETVRVSQEISGRVASAVMALQVGDSTRQRVQHGEMALEDLEGWLGGDTPGEIAVTSDDGAPIAALVFELAQAQLEGTLDVFGREIVEAEQALMELATDASGAIADSRRLYGAGEAAGKSSLAALGAEMRRAALLLRACAAERTRLAGMATLVDETVEVLIGHVEAVQEIEANMRLVGLNAAVKCAQLGPRGAALSVIAAQLRELTGDLVPAAKTAVARLGEAMAAARAFSAASTGQLAQEVTGLEQEAAGAMALVEAVDGRLSDALATLEADGPQATALLAAASTGLGGHTSIAEALADARFRLAELAAATGGVAPAPELASAVLKRLRRGYSMEDERRIHDALAQRLLPAEAADSAPGQRASGAAPALEAPAAATDEAAVDDVLFF